MLNLGFQNFRPIILKSIFFSSDNFFCTYGFLHELKFSLLTFEDKVVEY